MRTGLMLAAVALSGAASAQLFTDNFNRADSADLGPNYSLFGTGATRVISNRAGNVAGTNALSLVTAGNFSASYLTTVVQADVFAGAGLNYVALAFGHNGLTTAGNGLFIKVQGTDNFSSIGFYTGINGTTTTFWSDPPIFFTSTATFTSARMQVFAADATTIMLTLDTDFNGTPDQTYSRHLNLGSMTFGTQAGLHVFGAGARADDFSASAVPEPISLTAFGIGLAALVRRRRR